MEEISVDFRLIAATNEDLKKMVEQKLFREDLFYRLNILLVHLPALKDRREDILPLIRYFRSMYCDKYKKNIIFHEDAIQLMMEYDWPGNIRELKNIVERTVVMSKKEYVDRSDMQKIIGDLSDTSVDSVVLSTPDKENIYETMLQKKVSLQAYIEECEKEYLKYALDRYGSSYKAADALQTTQSMVIRRKSKYKL